MLSNFEDFYGIKREVSQSIAQSFWDYTAGRCLVRREIFHPGFYCFQQAVEKLLKAILYQIDTTDKDLDTFGKQKNHGVRTLYKEYLEKFPNFQSCANFEQLIPEVQQWFHTRYPKDPRLELKQFSSKKIHEIDRFYFEILTSSGLSARFLTGSNYFQALKDQNVRGYEEVFADNHQLNPARQFIENSLNDR